MWSPRRFLGRLVSASGSRVPAISAPLATSAVSSRPDPHNNGQLEERDDQVEGVQKRHDRLDCDYPPPNEEMSRPIEIPDFPPSLLAQVDALIRSMHIGNPLITE